MYMRVLKLNLFINMHTFFRIQIKVSSGIKCFSGNPRAFKGLQ